MGLQSGGFCIEVVVVEFLFLIECFSLFVAFSECFQTENQLDVHEEESKHI